MEVVLTFVRQVVVLMDLVVVILVAVVQTEIGKNKMPKNITLQRLFKSSDKPAAEQIKL